MRFSHAKYALTAAQRDCRKSLHLKKWLLKTKDFFRGNLRHLRFFDSLNKALHRIAATLRFGKI
jgi:hypothetical protein